MCYQYAPREMKLLYNWGIMLQMKGGKKQMKLKICNAPCKTQINYLKRVISLPFKNKLFEVKYCSFKIINTAVSSVMKPLLPFHPVEVKHKHGMNIFIFAVAYQCLPQGRSLAVTAAAGLCIWHFTYIVQNSCQQCVWASPRKWHDVT